MKFSTIKHSCSPSDFDIPADLASDINNEDNLSG